MNKDQVIWAIALLGAILLLLFGPEHSLFDNIKKQRLERYYQQRFEKHKIICTQCKGSGEYPTDVNKLMMDAKMQLFVNKHFTVDKCQKCVKLEDDGYSYCQTVNDYYQTLVKEYDSVGPKIQMTACGQCMGMGQFTCQNKDGSYMTQEEYDQKHQK